MTRAFALRQTKAHLPEAARRQRVAARNEFGHLAEHVKRLPALLTNPTTPLG